MSYFCNILIFSVYLPFPVTKLKLMFENVICFFLHQVFDTTRKITYKNLTNWYKELRQHRPEIPCVCGANKIDGENLFVYADISTLLLFAESGNIFSTFGNALLHM